MDHEERSRLEADAQSRQDEQERKGERANRIHFHVVIDLDELTEPLTIDADTITELLNDSLRDNRSRARVSFVSQIEAQVGAVLETVHQQADQTRRLGDSLAASVQRLPDQPAGTIE